MTQNKTIRVWNRQVDCCGHCPLSWGNEYSEYMCQDLPGEILDTDIIHPDCPFSKPLSKEDIESCGFVMFVDYGAGTDFKLGDKYLLRIYKHAGLTYNINQVIIFKNSGIFGNNYNERLFIGDLNNLPEFKLILKMLNIE